MHQRFLVIGQGLAGTLAALTLMEHEQAVTIVDTLDPHCASRVAAGLMNPITGQRLVVAADVKQCLPFAIDRYKKLAKQFGRNFYHAIPMSRLFKDVADKDRLLARKKDPSFNEFLGGEFNPGESGEPVKDALGGYRQKQTGYLDISAVLDCLREYFLQQGILLEQKFDYQSLNLDDNSVWWQGEQYDHVIFCDGARAVNNPWFRWLPFQLSKGELITITGQTALPTTIINKGHWLLPQESSQAKVGASYCWEWSDELPSADAKATLMNWCHETLEVIHKYQVTDHQSGIRPTTKDKQPFIGTHPLHKQLHCLNGFGSRGALLIPLYANHLVTNILLKSPIPIEIDISRFQRTTSLVVVARRYLSEHILPGDFVIDATAGNGHDTELMARCVGDNGKVLGFDVQRQAIDNARQRIQRAGLETRVSLIQDNHANFKQYINDDELKKFSLMVFNLGFLPGSDKSCTTLSETTLKALDDAISLIKKSGSIVVMTYPGHLCGKKETNSVKQWVDSLDKKHFHCQKFETKQKFDAPSLFIITKSKNIS